MPVKRRNHGRNKKNRGYQKPIVCSNCGRICPKDKAIKRFTIRDIVDASSKKDLEENRAFETYIIPKLYIKMQYCISCGIHSRIVKVRSNTDRKSRLPPQRIQRDAAGKSVGANANAGKWFWSIFNLYYFPITPYIVQPVQAQISKIFEQTSYFPIFHPEILSLSP